MSRGDALDLVLNKIHNIEDWQSLVEVCECENMIKVEDFSHIGLVKKFNQEIRSNYGHTFFNIFRDEYEPGYEDILRDTALKLEIKGVPDKLNSMYDIEYTERLIISKVLEQIRDAIIKEKGYAAWEKIEAEANENMENLYREGKINADDYEKYIEMATHGGSMIALIIAGRLSGFALYALANQLFFAIARFLGIKVGVAVAGPIIGRTISALLGPLAWVLAGLWLLVDLGSTSWKKTIGAVFFVAILRQQQKYAEQCLEIKEIPQNL